jgi:thiamine biosynthesis lipoprotein
VSGTDPAWSAGALTRRRATTITAAAAGLSLLWATDRTRRAAPLYHWTGSSLGSPSRLALCHPDRVAAGRLVGRCVAEIVRLERIFALYRNDSELARLNRNGRLDDPSFDLLVVLSLASRLSDLSGGAFDMTVQPLWDLYAGHFFRSPAPRSSGPDPEAIERARALVDWRAVDLGTRRIALRPGMGVTLNGIAQGYVTDRVIDILRQEGCERVLADMGCSELRALGRRADGGPWRVGLADPRASESLAMTLDLLDGALCTSGGYGTKFEASGRFHHLFDPATGLSAHHVIGVSVFASNATVADALSTALYVTPPDRIANLLNGFPGTSALVTQLDGRMLWVPS